MAKAYMFSFDVHNAPSTDVWSKIEADIKIQFPDSVKILNTTYIIGTNHSNIQDRMKAIFDKYVHQNSYEFYGSEITKNKFGWLYEPKWKKINDILAKVFALV